LEVSLLSHSRRRCKTGLWSPRLKLELCRLSATHKILRIKVEDQGLSK
jgi:hypothetical protein